ncbi:hypothetical protein [Devosia ginsengisoli]|uniref:hypothetical protein n=1 Tax=Devosia ginsengisoli TaxID=400770 RepID=UPI0026EBFFBD|nr:hypothetical protein [Devosia ginsengisoli]MCR6673256.1 hypothetical protein [Devosia ginsengisoli]
MTLPPERIGDKGQRFALYATGWPKDGANEIAYGDDKWKLADMGYALLARPGVGEAWLLDRRTNEKIEIER